MNRRIRFSCLFALAFAAFFAGPWAVSAETADSDQAKAELAAIRGRIADLTTRLGAQLKDRDALAARVREADLTITANRRRLEALRNAQAAAERHRTDLRAEQSRNRTALDAERAALAAQVRAAYLMGRQEQIKLLLNQSDPASAGRMLEYYGFFARARGTRIDDIRSQLAQVQRLVGEIDETTAKLAAVQNDARQELTDLQRARDERAAALTAVNLEVRSDTQDLERLKREEQAKEALLADLARVLQDFPVETPQDFDTLRGRLAWPVPGRISTRYQDPRTGAGQSDLRWNGVLIDSTRGAKVRAPYFGRVVYADWLQGLGLLLIIGHSGNYMTLYGHAEVLYKSVGDWVAPGDVIAALSDSSGASPQLYFEIRDGRRAMDPKSWLKPSP